LTRLFWLNEGEESYFDNIINSNYNLGERGSFSSKVVEIFT
jgi:hypothetical protein